MEAVAVPRIDVEQARRKVKANQALLVCAYDDVAKCRQVELEGSVPISELESRLTALPKDQELIFYCA
jgi:hypothetical protein